MGELTGIALPFEGTLGFSFNISNVWGALIFVIFRKILEAWGFFVVQTEWNYWIFS